MLEFAKKTCLKAAKILAGHYDNEHLGIDYKSKFEPVTREDREVEKFLVKEITKKYPKHGIIGEENSRKESECGYTWVIDPLDGTINYMRRFPYFAVSIAVLKDNEPFIGVVCNPVTKEIFYAQKDRGAFRNGKKISVSRVDSLEKAYLSTGLSYSRGANLRNSLKKIMKVLKKALVVRRTGSAALDLCNVATGTFDGFFMQGIKKWDVLAGAIIVREAGGECLLKDSGDGKSLDIVATNGIIQEKIEKMMK